MDYTAGSTIAGTSGGSGWVDSWASTGDATDDGMAAPGLTYTDGSAKTLVTGGNTSEMHPGGDGSPSYLDFTRNLDRTLGNDDDVVYTSFLVKHVAANGGLDYRMGFGGLDLVVRGWHPSWGLNGNGNTGIAKPAVGETQFIVLKVTYAAGDDTAELWVNPDLTTPGAAGYSTTLSLSSYTEMKFSQQNANGFPGETNQWDEIRVGDTWAEVAPVIPEPAFGLIALLGAFVLRFRK
jgi:hypothetical protein